MKEQVLNLVSKLHEIAKLPRSKALQYFDGLDITSFGITYKTSDFYAGSTEYSDFIVGWDEIDNPLEYFAERFKKEHENDLKQKEIRELNRKEDLASERRKEYEKLKKEFEE